MRLRRSFVKCYDGGMETFSGRGVHYFSGQIECPLAGVGGRGTHDSNRIVLDDGDTEVIVDRDTKRITVKNDRRYEKKTVVADLMFLAEGKTASDTTSPLGIHLKVMKEGTEPAID